MSQYFEFLAENRSEIYDIVSNIGKVDNGEIISQLISNYSQKTNQILLYLALSLADMLIYKTYLYNSILDFFITYNNQFSNDLILSFAESCFKQRSDTEFQIEECLFFMLRDLLEKEIITIENIYILFENYQNLSPNKAFLAFFIFLPYIIDNQDLFKKLHGYLLSSQTLDRNCKEYLWKIEDFKKNNWLLFRNEIVMNTQDDVINMIINDDIESLSSYDDLESFMLTKKFGIFRFYYHLRKAKEIIDVACFFGSLKCLEYIVDRYVVKKKTNAQYFAIASGNLDVVKFLDSKGFPFIEFIPAAAYFHQMEILNWIMMEKRLQIINRIGVINKCMIECAKSDNISLFVEFLAQKVNFKTVDEHKRNVLSYACEYGNLEMFGIVFLKFPELINQQDIDGSTPLHYAVKNLHHEIVKYILNNSETNLNIRDSSSRTAFDYANTTILELLNQRKE